MGRKAIFPIPENKKEKSRVRENYTLCYVSGERGMLFCYINRRIKTKKGAHCNWHSAETNTSMVSCLSECFVLITSKYDNEDICYSKMKTENEDMETNSASKSKAQCNPDAPVHTEEGHR